MADAQVPRDRWADCEQLFDCAVTTYHHMQKPSRLSVKEAQRELAAMAKGMRTVVDGFITRLVADGSITRLVALLDATGSSANLRDVIDDTRTILAARPALDRLARIAESAGRPSRDRRGHPAVKLCKPRNDGSLDIGAGATFAALLAHLYRFATGRPPTAASKGMYFSLVELGLVAAGASVADAARYVRAGIDLTRTMGRESCPIVQ